MIPRRLLLSVPALALLIAAPRLAHADSRTAMAETLFDEGRALLLRGSFTEACPKLAESQALDPGDGTLLALAMCHEGEGKIAQAWSELTQLAGKTEARRDRVEKAKERLAAIEPKLARMSIVVPEAIRVGEPTLEILRDGVPLGRAAWDTASPVDPGAHVVEVRAKGKTPARIELSIASGRVSEIVMPVLESAPTPRAPAPAGTASTGPDLRSSSEGVAMRTTGIVVGSIGLAAIGTGIYFGARAMKLSERAQRECPTTTLCSSEALEHNSDAASAARVSNVAVIGGAVTLGGGILVYLLAPRAKTTVIPYAGVSGGGAMVTSSF